MVFLDKNNFEVIVKGMFAKYMIREDGKPFVVVFHDNKEGLIALKSGNEKYYANLICNEKKIYKSDNNMHFSLAPWTKPVRI